MVRRFVTLILINQTREYGFNMPALSGRATEPRSLILAVMIHSDNQCVCGVAQFVQSADNLLHLGRFVFIFIAGSQSHCVEKDGYQINPVFVFHFRRVTLHQSNQRIWAIIEQVWLEGVPGKWQSRPFPQLHLLVEHGVECCGNAHMEGGLALSTRYSTPPWRLMR